MKEFDLFALNFPNYKIDSDVTIYSWKCKAGTKTKRWKQLKPWTVKGGYKVIGLKINGKRICKCIHSLILEAFVGPCPPDKEGCHNNSNPADNRLENLRWDTPKNNCIDRKHNNLHSIKTPKGGKHGMAKLKKQEVLAIRKLFELKIFKQIRLAKLFEVTPTTVCDIINRKIWKEI